MCARSIDHGTRTVYLQRVSSIIMQRVSSIQGVFNTEHKVCPYRGCPQYRVSSIRNTKCVLIILMQRVSSLQRASSVQSVLNTELEGILNSSVVYYVSSGSGWLLCGMVV